jgi:DNA replication protein DnaC
MNNELGMTDLYSTLKANGRALLFSNKTIEEYALRSTPEQLRFITEMMDYELARREENKRVKLLKKAAFPRVKSFTGYEWDNIKLPAQLKREDIENSTFIYHSMNLVLYGPVGTGKTHMAIAAGRAACDIGLRVRFLTVSELVVRLTEAKASGSLNKTMADILKCDCLILDEFGYVPIDRESAQLLFQVISNCYETRSLIITTNVEFSRWGTVLTDDQMAAAMIDRIAHHGHLIVFDGESYRIRHALMRQ